MFGFSADRVFNEVLSTCHVAIILPMESFVLSYVAIPRDQSRDQSRDHANMVHVRF